MTKILYVAYTSLFLIIWKVLLYVNSTQETDITQFYIVFVIGQRIIPLIQKYL